MGLGLAVVVIGLVVRMITSFLVVLGTSLELRERLFIPFAWLPKATVQVEIDGLLNHGLSNKYMPLFETP